MTLLKCLLTNSPISGDNHHSLWNASMISMSIFYFLIFFYGLILIKRNWKAIKSSPMIHSVSRICFTLALFFKGAGEIISVILAKKLKPQEHLKDLRMAGYVCLEFPSYFITTCYTIVMILWLSISLQILPSRYEKIFRRVKFGLVVYNVIMYILFAISLYIESTLEYKPYDPGHNDSRFAISGIFDVARDLVLCVIFIFYMLVMHSGLNSDFFEQDKDTLHNMFFAIVLLSVLVLLRGVISLTQGYIPGKECDMPFYLCYLFSDIVIEGFPMFLLLYISKDAVENQRRMSVELSTTALTSSYMR